MRLLVNILLILVITTGIGFSQNIPVEAMAGRENYWYQHVLSKRFTPESRFGFFHVSSLHVFYDKQKTDEIMSQSYLTYSLTGSVHLAVGGFYATGPGFSPAIAIQFVKKVDDLLILVVPRVDLRKGGSYESMVMLEYTPQFNEKVGLYSRFQYMGNYSRDDHNRSYQNIRAGLDYRAFQFGFALNIDEYGENFKPYYNPGIFIRTEL